MVTSIVLHNIPEGLAIGVAFGSIIYNIEGATLIAAISLAIGIGLQNIPEGAAISIPLRKEGLSRKKSFLIGALSGIVEPISAIIGVILVLKIKIILPILLSFAAGAMLFVIIEELVPECMNDENKKCNWRCHSYRIYTHDGHGNYLDTYVSFFIKKEVYFYTSN